MIEKLKPLYPLIDLSIVAPGDIEQVAEKILSGGAGVIQLRAKGASARDTILAARRLRAVTAKSGAAFIVNDRVDVALLSGADGVHLGQDDLPIMEARSLLGPDKLIGISTHNEEEALVAMEAGADYISLGPVFETTSKDDAQEPRGLEMLRRVIIAVSAPHALPVVAIGGINEDDAESLIEEGAYAVAMISEILGAASTTAKVKSILERLHPVSP